MVQCSLLNCKQSTKYINGLQGENHERIQGGQAKSYRMVGFQGEMLEFDLFHRYNAT